MDTTILTQTIQRLSHRGKGILAADESNPTIKKRFDSIDVESTEENRRAYRECLLATPLLEQYISGVILFEETLGQATQDGKPFAQLLNEKGIEVGIKVDKGLVPHSECPEEKVTQGLDGLAQRLEQYRAQGATFAKWRAVYQISDTTPSEAVVESNAQNLANYAYLCQQASIVPIVEPEVLIDGDHSLERCQTVTENVLRAVFKHLEAKGVQLEHIVLKPSMVIAGKSSSVQADMNQVAAATLEVFKQCIPESVPTINFLSGGQTPEQATAHLNQINAAPMPWHLSFSYGRALQEPCLKAWAGDAQNVASAQQALFHRARLNSAAVLGEYKTEMEDELLESTPS